MRSTTEPAGPVRLWRVKQQNPAIPPVDALGDTTAGATGHSLLQCLAGVQRRPERRREAPAAV
jgi:hypothetical protein